VLAAIPGVALVQSASPTLFRVQFHPDHDATEQLAALAAHNDWGLYQMTPAHSSLEDVFAHLTRSEDSH
jgi:hypothetical protein